MSRFASFVLARERVFWLDDSELHAEIISAFGLHEWGVRGPNLVKVEIWPVKTLPVWPSLKAWRFFIDQDVFPQWHSPEITEQRTRAALARRYQKGFQRIDVSGWESLTKLNARRAGQVLAYGCTALKTLVATHAEYVDVRNCTALHELRAERATTVYLDGCPRLQRPPGGRVDPVGDPFPSPVSGYFRG